MLNKKIQEIVEVTKLLIKEIIKARAEYLDWRKKLTERRKHLVRYCLWYIKSSRIAYYTTLPIFYPVRLVIRKMYWRYKKIRAAYQYFKSKKGWMMLFWLSGTLLHFVFAKYVFYESFYIKFL
jgi:hypothetical protein